MWRPSLLGSDVHRWTFTYIMTCTKIGVALSAPELCVEEESTWWVVLQAWRVVVIESDCSILQQVQSWRHVTGVSAQVDSKAPRLQHLPIESLVPHHSGRDLGACTVLNLYESTWVHKRVIILDLAVLRIHTINTFRIEKYSRILTLNIYLTRNTSIHKDI